MTAWEDSWLRHLFGILELLIPKASEDSDIEAFGHKDHTTKDFWAVLSLSNLVKEPPNALQTALWVWKNVYRVQVLGFEASTLGFRVYGSITIGI